MEEEPNGEEGWIPATREFASLKDFLERESLSRHEGRLALYDRPVVERVASGTAIDRLVFQRKEPGRDQDFLIFAAAKNDSRLRPGSRVRLSRGDPRKGAIRLELVEDSFDGKKYLLRLAGGPENTEPFESAEPWVLDEDVFDLLDLQVAILRSAQEKGLGSWLDGSEPYPPAASGSSPLSSRLTGNLREVFERALGARPYFAVQGPPGSGKTHLLAWLALHYALIEGKRVLITAVSHHAIHNALAETYWVGRRLAKTDPAALDLLHAHFYKIGASKGNNEGLPDGVQSRVRAPSRLRPLIAGGTTYSAMLAYSAARPNYDVVLFDEAGQAPLILALAARVLAPKAVFIGDDAQLPPVVEAPPEEEGDPLTRVSALAFIRERYEAPALLTETRRLNAEICSVVSDCFYGGKLAPSPGAASRRFELKTSPAPGFSRLFDPDRGLIFLDVPHSSCKAVSEPEALWASAIAREAVRCGLPPEEIGVIAPYRAQCNRIRFLLEGSGVVVSTVERFQGQEREMVLISLTSSSPRYLARLAAFLFSPNRLNVAISRARSKVILLGARSALSSAAETEDADSEGAAGFSIFRRILAAAAAEEAGGLPGSEGREPVPGASKGRKRSSSPSPAFEPGAAVEHPKYGPGVVLSKSVQLIDNAREWVNEIRFSDGEVRMVVPRLTQPPMRGLE